VVAYGRQPESLLPDIHSDMVDRLALGGGKGLEDEPQCLRGDPTPFILDLHDATGCHAPPSHKWSLRPSGREPAKVLVSRPKTRAEFFQRLNSVSSSDRSRF